MKAIHINKIKKILVYVLIFFLFLICFATINNFITDNYWNYGFGYNIVKGMVPYRDFNVILFPLSLFLSAGFMKILGTKLIVYYIYSSLIATLIVYLVCSLGKKNIALIIIFFMILFETGGYNYLSLLMLFLLIYLEEKKKNDFLIGLVLGLAFVTNQKLILLVIPTLFLKDFSRIMTRFKAFIVPVQIMLLYLFANSALYKFIDYTFLGLFDFGNKNSHFDFIFLFEMVIILYLVFKYLKSKDKKVLYCLCFQVIAIPIFDPYHVSVGLIPFIFCACNIKKKSLLLVNSIFFILLYFVIIGRVYTFSHDDILSIDLDSKSNYFLTLKSQKVERYSSTFLNYYYNSPYKVYFLSGDAYYFKLRGGLPIDQFDLVSNGNNGYNGTKKVEEEIKKVKEAAMIVCAISSEYDKYNQTNHQVIKFIQNNYELIDDLGYDCKVYKIVN